MAIKHVVVKIKGEKGLASEWNADHKIDGNVDFLGYEAQNLTAHSGVVFPALPVEGQLFYRTDLTTLFFYDGDNWVGWIEATSRYEFYITGDEFTGTNTAVAANKLIAAGATFQTYGITAGDAVYNFTDKKWSSVVSVDSQVQLTLADNIFLNVGRTYYVYTHDSIYGANCAAQTFTTGTVSTVEKVVLRSIKLKLYKVLAPGTIYVALRAVDGANKPTGPDLSTGEINGYSISENAAGGWYDIVMSPYELQKSTQYAIVVRAPGGNAANYLCWQVDKAGATYAGGSKLTSADGGFTWTIDANADFMFEVWGTRVYELVWEVDGADLQMTTARPMDMRSQKINTLSDPTANQDAATKKYVDDADALRLLLAGGTMSGAIAMATNTITGLGDPTAAQDAATKNYVDVNLPPIRTKDMAAVANTALNAGYQTVATAVVNGVEANDVVIVCYNIRYVFQAAAADGYSQVLRAGGAVPGATTLQVSQDTAHGTVRENVSCLVYETPGAGNHTYELQSKSNVGGSSAEDGNLVIIVLKG